MAFEVDPSKRPTLCDMIKQGATLESLSAFLETGNNTGQIEKPIPINLYQSLASAIVTCYLTGKSGWISRVNYTFMKIAGWQEYPFARPFVDLVDRHGAKLYELVCATKKEFFDQQFPTLTLERFKQGVLHHTPPVFHPLIEKAFEESDAVQGASVEVVQGASAEVVQEASADA
jgi:hypothetical protein